jgi:vacuolar-type H+-ATPase subunit B/Vma2
MQKNNHSNNLISLIKKTGKKRRGKLLYFDKELKCCRYEIDSTRDAIKKEKNLKRKGEKHKIRYAISIFSTSLSKTVSVSRQG